MGCRVRVQGCCAGLRSDGTEWDQLERITWMGRDGTRWDEMSLGQSSAAKGREALYESGAGCLRDLVIVSQSFACVSSLWVRV